MRLRCIKDDTFRGFTKGRIYGGKVRAENSECGLELTNDEGGSVYGHSGLCRGSCIMSGNAIWTIEHFEPIDFPVKYKLLRPITGRSLVADGPSGCGEFQEEIAKFITRYGLDECATSRFMGVDEYVAQVRPNNLKWLIDNGYLEWVEVERTYHVGQRVMIKRCTGPEEYIIARLSRFEVALIGLSDGNRWSKVRKVEDSTNITQAEMNKMVDPQIFQGIVE